MKTTGNEGRAFYEQFLNKRIYVKCTEGDPGQPCDYLNTKVIEVRNDGIIITDPTTRFIPFDKITEIGEQDYQAAL